MLDIGSFWVPSNSVIHLGCNSYLYFSSSRKSFDNASVFSEFKSFDGDINELQIQLFINDELKQDGNVSMMINKPYEIIKEANTFLSFEDGDILMSGTPKGVGEFKVGDRFLGKILYKNEILIEKEFIVS